MRNLASILLASAAFVVATSLLPVTANAQTAVTCTPIDTSTFPGAAAKSCIGSGRPAFAGIFNSTIQSLSTSASDSASRLTTQIPSNDIGATVSITITDPVFAPSGSTTLSYEIAQGDTLYTIEQALTNQINALSDLYAYQNSAAAITIYSFSGNTTTYSASVTDSISPPSETISLSTDGNGNEVVTMTAPLSTNTWFLYANHTDYYTQASVTPHPSDGPPDYNTSLGDAFGTTEDTALNPNSAIFENTSPDTSTPNNVIAHTTAHETGHQLDAIYGLLKDPGQGPNPDYSLSTDFINAFNRDTTKVNLTLPCAYDASDRDNNDSPDNNYADHPGDHGYYASSGTPEPNLTGGLPGLFSGLQDSSGNYICTDKTEGSPDGMGRALAGSYSGFSATGSDNQSIINLAFPFLTSISAGGIDARKEVFAEEYANMFNFPDTQDNIGATIFGSDTILSRAYKCTQLYVFSLTNTGQLPTAADLAGTGYLSQNTFSGDANGVMYGPTTPSSEYFFTLNACDNSTTQQLKSELMHSASKT